MTRYRNDRGIWTAVPSAPLSVADRFWAKVDKTANSAGCWPWQGPTTRGYGRFQKDGANQYAHRVAYELEVGPIPAGMTIDHACWTPLCVNPAHLRVMDHLTNSARQRSAERETCIHGHPFDEANTRWSRSPNHGGVRNCRACANERQKAYLRRLSGTVKVSAG